MIDCSIKFPPFHRRNWHNVPAVELFMYRLEPLSEKHIESLAKLLIDPRFFGFYDGFRKNMSQARYALNAVAKRGGHFAVVEKKDSKVLGEVTILEEKGHWELGYWLGAEYWGKGIMGRVMKEFVEWVRANTSIVELYAECSESNLPSKAIIDSCGIKRINKES